MKYLKNIKGMRNMPTPIGKKICSLPNSYNYQKNYLELYILAKNKSRMEQELETLEERRNIILKNHSMMERKMETCKYILESNDRNHCNKPDSKPSSIYNEICLEY